MIAHDWQRSGLHVNEAKLWLRHCAHNLQTLTFFPPSTSATGIKTSPRFKKRFDYKPQQNQKDEY
jgi:hypothetical protein